MCGIVGLFGGKLDCLAQANDCLTHRGPDDSGLFLDPSAGVGIGHRRLSILDLSPSGHQPMVSNNGQIALVFNGEIYNFRELRAELEAKGYHFRGNSDTEVLLNLYLAEGDAMLPRLNGVFAFALWDACRQQLLLARDALGVKPLYYTFLGGCFAFASEIKALLPLMPKGFSVDDLDVDALHRYMSFLWCPGNATPFKGVHKLGPGEAIVAQHGHIVKKFTWYRLPVFRGVRQELNEGASVRGTLDHLRTAVHRQMVADVPVGAFLSGGLDSSSVVAMAREVNPDISCFTIHAPEGGESGMVDDLPYARMVATHLRVPLDVVSVDSARMAAGLEAMVAQLDEPLADPAPLNVFFISQLARDHGIKVLLSGAGGDDLFTGYRRHWAVTSERYWSWLPGSVRAMLENASARLDQRRAFGRRLRKLFSGASLEGDARLINYFLWNQRDDLWALYTPAFRAALEDTVAVTPMREFLAEMPSATQPIERMLALEQRFFLADHNLIYTDKMSMAAGVEVRVPFLDLDLVEFAQMIPSRFKQRGREGKWVLKKAMEPYLPHDVIYRPKSGFGAPLRRWMRFELRELLGDVLGETSLSRRGLFDPLAVQRLIAANDKGKVDASYTLLSLLCIELWCRRFLDQSGGSPIQ